MAQTVGGLMWLAARGPSRLTARWSSRTTLGVPPEKARNLEDRLKQLRAEDQVATGVNIGFAVKKLKRKDETADHVKLLKANRKNKELEQLARDNRLVVPLDKVDEDNAETLTPLQVRSVAEHYGIYQHLFGDAFFYPVVNMHVSYANETVPVYRGNVVKPEEATSEPSVQFNAQPTDLWTLVLTTPDGTRNEVERIHWLVGNIRGNDIGGGEQLRPYVQPLPLQGLGSLRYVFVLYKQSELINYSELKQKLVTTQFFSTLKFYATRQEVLTPAGLSFFVSDWDPSVRDYYRTVLNQEPPSYEYDFPEPVYKKQKWFPLREAFNLYLDRYRDEKDIAQEHLVKKLRATDPFKGDLRPKWPYPNAVPIPKGTPSWLKNEVKKERLGRARFADYS